MIDCWKGVLIHAVFVSAQPIYITLRYASAPSYLTQTSPSWLAFTAITWIYIVLKISIPFFRSPLRHLPSPSNDRFLIGHLDFNGGRPPTENIAWMLRNTPNDGLIVLWSAFHLIVQVIPTRPETLMDMLNTHNYDWEKPAASKRFLARTLGEGLVNAEGDAHKSMRKAVAPAFSGRHIRDLTSLFWVKGIAFAESLARELKASPNHSVEIMSHMSRVTLDIIGAAGVGKDFDTITNDEDLLAKLYADITDTNRGPLLLFVLVQNFLPTWIIKYLSGTPYQRIARAQAQLRLEVRKLLQEKKTVMLEEKAEQQKDIIAIIMRSGEWTDDQLVDQLLTFLAAGHDTTASALTWTIYLLCLHPEIQNRLRAECDAKLSDASSSGSDTIDASYFDPETTPYLHAVCNETLRLYPTVPATARHAVKDTYIGGHFIPAGTSAIVPLWAINRDKTLWGNDAEEYRPDRWLGENMTVNATGGAESHYALLTFLHGPRSCIGQSFARTEMKCLLASLVMRFRFDLADPHKEVEIGGFVTIKPWGGLKVKLHDLKERKRRGEEEV